MSRRRSIVLSTLASMLILVVAPAAFAKEGGIARFDAPVPLDAAPGSTIAVGWAATVRDGAAEHPIEGSPLFVRLVSPTGATTEEGGVEDPPGSGHYVADVVVPAGGIARVEIGLLGTACDALGCRRSDWLLEIVDEASGFEAPPAPAVAAPAAPGPAASRRAETAGPDAIVPTWFAVLAAGLAGAVVVGAGVMGVGRARPRGGAVTPGG